MHPGAKTEKDKTAKNPVSHWRVSRRGIVGERDSRSRIVGTTTNTAYCADFVFSPDAKFLAAISEDGCLRVIDTVAEQYVSSGHAISATS